MADVSAIVPVGTRGRESAQQPTPPRRRILVAGAVDDAGAVGGWASGGVAFPPRGLTQFDYANGWFSATQRATDW